MCNIFLQFLQCILIFHVKAVFVTFYPEYTRGINFRLDELDFDSYYLL